MQVNLLASNNTVPANVKLSASGKVFDLPPQQTWQQQPSNIQSANVSAAQVTNPVRSETRKCIFATCAQNDTLRIQKVIFLSFRGKKYRIRLDWKIAISTSYPPLELQRTQLLIEIVHFCWGKFLKSVIE